MERIPNENGENLTKLTAGVNKLYELHEKGVQGALDLYNNYTTRKQEINDIEDLRTRQQLTYDLSEGVYLAIQQLQDGRYGGLEAKAYEVLDSKVNY